MEYRDGKCLCEIRKSFLLMQVLGNQEKDVIVLF